MPELRDLVGSGGSSGVEGMPCIKALKFAVTLVWWPLSMAQAACETSVDVFYDASASTSSAPNVSNLLIKMKATAPWKEVRVQPFAGSLGTPCLIDMTENSDIFANQISACNSSINKSIAGTTNLSQVIDTITAAASKPPPLDQRRIMLILSDFLHDTQATVSTNSADWRLDYRSKLAILRDLLDRTRNQELLLFEQPGTGADQGHQILQDLAVLLREYFHVARVQDQLQFDSMVAQRLTGDPRPLTVEVIEVLVDGIKAKIANPACVDRQLDNAEIIYRDGRGGFLSVDGLPGKISASDKSSELKLAWDPLTTLPASCISALLRVRAKTPAWASGDSEEFTFGDCLLLERVDLDVFKNAIGSKNFRDCSLTRNRIQQVQQTSHQGTIPKDPLEAWKDEDLKKEGEITFAACFRARGLLLHGNALFSLKSEAGKISDLTLRSNRFMSGLLSDTARGIPVFFSLSKKEARAICIGQAHQEVVKPISLEADANWTGWPSLADKVVLLSRDRNREAEENLHDLWESASIPLLLLLFLVGFAMWGARRTSVGAAEGYLGALGVVIFGFAAAMHDATNLGDWVEEFSAENLWVSYLVLGLISLALLWFVWLGAFERQQSKEVALIEMELRNRKERTRRFRLRLGFWAGLIVVFLGFSVLALWKTPKDIEECHYFGAVEPRSQKIGPGSNP